MGAQRGTQRSGCGPRKWGLACGGWCKGPGHDLVIGFPHRFQPCGQSKGRGGGGVCHAQDWGTGWAAPGCTPPAPPLCLPRRLHARFYELAPNLVPMDYRKSPVVHVPMSLIIQMPELRVRARLLPPGGAGTQAAHAPRPQLRLLCPPGLACSPAP